MNKGPDKICFCRQCGAVMAVWVPGGTGTTFTNKGSQWHSGRCPVKGIPWGYRKWLRLDGAVAIWNERPTTDEQPL